jgi:hypothetical protein
MTLCRGTANTVRQHYLLVSRQVGAGASYTVASLIGGNQPHRIELGIILTVVSRDAEVGIAERLRSQPAPLNRRGRAAGRPQRTDQRDIVEPVERKEVDHYSQCNRTRAKVCVGRSIRSDGTMAYEVVMNATKIDGSVLSHTIPHLLRTHKDTIARLTVVIDERKRTGRLQAAEAEHDVVQMLSEIASVVSSTPINVVRLDYSQAKATMRRWFGNERVAARCAGGTPLLAFLFGMDQASAEYVLRTDCDMMYFDGSSPYGWLSAARRLLDDYPDIYFVSPYLGPPGCSGSNGIIAKKGETGLRLGQAFSTRCFFYKRSKLESLLPLARAMHPLPKRFQYCAQGRSGERALEESIAMTLKARGTYRCDLEPSSAIAIHVAHRRRFAEPGFESIVCDVEHGRFPECQAGCHNLSDEWLSKRKVTGEDGAT